MLAAQAATCRPDLVCFSHLRWDFVYQRPQQLLSRAARKYRVFFIEEPIFLRDVEPHLHVSERSEGMRILVPRLRQGSSRDEADAQIRELISRFLRDSPGERRVLWYYTPMAVAFSRDMAAAAVVYDNMDELSAFLGASPRLLELEEELFARADLVFTGGMSLYAAKRNRHRSVHALPSSVDAAHFAAARGRKGREPADQSEIPRPRIGFFGVIDERMNLELVRNVAELRPDWMFVMIGPVVKIDPAILPQRANIHWLGPKPYAELPRYLAGWDAGFMPFARNEATRFISPTKTPEFLAAGLPLVSTAINDVVEPYGEKRLVEIADEPGDFVARLDKALQQPRAPWLVEVDRHLATMSWERTWARMDELIDALVASGTTGIRLTSPASTTANSMERRSSCSIG